MNIDVESAAIIGTLLGGIGKAVKEIPSIPNHYIPFILAGIGAIGYCLAHGWTGQNSLFGVFIAFGTVGAHQTIVKGKELAGK